MKLFYKDKMTETDQIIADFITKNSEIFLSLSITDTAKKCSVSPAMISKFTKKMGFKGFKDMQICVANEFSSLRINKIKDDDHITIIRKTIGSYIKYGLDNIIKNTKSEDILVIAHLLNNSEYIFSGGNGSSSFAAKNFNSRMRHLGKNAFYITRERDIILWGRKDKKNKTVMTFFTYSAKGEEFERIKKFAENQDIFLIIITANKKLKSSIKIFVVNFNTIDGDEEQFLDVYSPKIMLLFLSDIIADAYRDIFDVKNIERFKL